jgi:hypothetical protein
MKTMLGALMMAVLVAGAAQAGGRQWTQADVNKAIGPKNYTAFLAACTRSHIDENCSFLKSTADYAQADVKRRGVLAEQIMNFYIGSSAKKEVNLPAPKATALKTAYNTAKTSRSYPPALFSPAVTEITALLVGNINQNNVATFAPVLTALK